MNKYIKLVISLVLPLSVGGLSGFLTSNSVDTWYVTLVKPILNPPSWIFGPVWTTLYIMMGIALYLVWKSDFNQKDKAIKVFGVQLTLNFLWSILFFGLQNPALALVDIVLMLVFIVWNIVLFYRISKTAGWLLFPYFLWVSFATYLNLAIFLLN